MGIRNPRREGATWTFVDRQDEAISTADDYKRYFGWDGVPQAGMPLDELATGIFVTGLERGLELIVA